MVNPGSSKVKQSSNSPSQTHMGSKGTELTGSTTTDSLVLRSKPKIHLHTLNVHSGATKTIGNLEGCSYCFIQFEMKRRPLVWHEEVIISVSLNIQ
jgi:hypothetical protein